VIYHDTSRWSALGKAVIPLDVKPSDLTPRVDPSAAFIYIIINGTLEWVYYIKIMLHHWRYYTAAISL